MHRCFRHAKQNCTSLEIENLANGVYKAIDPINIAGLANPSCRNWYPVDANDMLNSAAKLQSTKSEISQLLDKSGFWK
jgi:FADH2 O2-dependent halogenase